MAGRKLKDLFKSKRRKEKGKGYRRVGTGEIWKEQDSPDWNTRNERETDGEVKNGLKEVSELGEICQY